MTTRTRIQLKLQHDTGSIFYQDKDDGDLAFHIEALRNTPLIQSSASTKPSGQAHTANLSDGEPQARGRSTPDYEEESVATTDLIKSFLRQHLLKNGEASRGLIPLMKKDGIEALLIAMVGLHLRKDGQGEDEDGVRDVGTAIRSLHKTLGSLISVLQQRERVLRYLEENPHVGLGHETEWEED
ncbi:hypothetical protein N8I77_008405 [Diaporthe amygdali]|uniref:Uncharacterized protein n=1 Tax=Phomopsis amygdali TaxID=1214568 RepID=A0AAD9SGD4_PHOAM|nr:hypothetical protein N8I77_008405 [Diaporthe amygdali]